MPRAEGRGAERELATVPVQVNLGEAMQFAVERGEECVLRAGVSGFGACDEDSELIA
jgi:hypothetical protein